VSEDFDTTLSQVIGIAATAAHTAGGPAARAHAGRRIKRRRIAAAAASLVVVAGGGTALFQLLPSSGGAAPPLTIASPHTSAGATVTVTAIPTAPTPSMPSTPATPSTATKKSAAPPPSTATSAPGTTASAPKTPSSPATSRTPAKPPASSAESGPFPGIWDITTWQQYQQAQTAVEQGSEPWLLDPKSVVSAWAAAQQWSSTPAVQQTATDTFQLTEPGTNVLYTIRGTCPDPSSAAPIWVITSISHT
jgi:hypothetical protein